MGPEPGQLRQPPLREQNGPMAPSEDLAKKVWDELDAGKSLYAIEQQEIATLRTARRYKQA